MKTEVSSVAIGIILMLMKHLIIKKMFYRLKVSFYFLKFTRLCIIYVLFILYKIIEFESDHTGVVTEPKTSRFEKQDVSADAEG